MTDQISEAKLLHRCRHGETAAWDELFRLHYAPAARFVFQLSSVLTQEDVQEICQETFLSVIKHIHTFEGQSQFQTWLFRIAANKTRDHLQRQHAAKRGGGSPVISLQAQQDTGLVLDPPSPHPGPDAELMSIEQMQLLRSALNQLEEPCREIVELRYFGDLSYDELSLALKLNPKTVSSRLSKCLDRLELIARPILERENPARFSV